MNLRTLQIFQTVCQEGNMSKAASKLYMTQPAISHAILDLEEELQVQLFDRFGKRIMLNEIGKNFLIKTQRVLLSYEELNTSLPSMEEESTIHIGSSITIANDYLPMILKQFKEKYPHTETKVYVESARNVLKRLSNHSIDLALVEGVITNQQWIQVPFSSYDLQVICSKEHPLSSRKTITWKDIKKASWLLREQGSAARDSFDSICTLHQIIIEPVWTSVNSQALLQAVRHNLGITLLPDSVLDKCPFKHELKNLSIQGEHLRNNNHIVYDKGKYLSEPLQYFLTLLENRE